MNIHIHTYILTYTYLFTYIYIPIYLHIHTFILTYTYTSSYIHYYIKIYRYAYITFNLLSTSQVTCYVCVSVYIESLHTNPQIRWFQSKTLIRTIIHKYLYHFITWHFSPDLGFSEMSHGYSNYDSLITYIMAGIGLRRPCAWKLVLFHTIFSWWWS